MFKLDHRADLDNLHYDSVYSGNVAVYRRKFECLGLKPTQKLKWTDGRSKLSKKKRHLQTDVRYYTERLGNSAAEAVIPAVRKGAGVNSLSDFVRVETEATAVKSDDALAQQTVDRHMNLLTGEYNRSLLEQPHNVDLWLEFLAFQDQLLEWGHFPGGETSDKFGRKNRALLERKMSIYTRALEHNPMSEELLVGHMALVQEVWTTQEIVKKWKDIVFRQPNKPLLWLGYIWYCQTNFSSFSTSSLISLYKKCITTLVSIYHGTLISHLPVPNTAAYLLAIFSLFCHFLHQVGLTERAVACYQALIEFNLCTPPELGEDEKSLKEFFETFWDSGAPRFGEAGAMGWHNWLKQTTTSSSAGTGVLGLVAHKLVTKSEPAPEPAPAANEDGECEEDPEVRLIADLPPTQAWLTLEEHRMVHNWSPWQPDVSGAGEEGEDVSSDPDRMVTYDDISQILFQLTDTKAKNDLVLSFLNFLGAPVSSPFESLVDMTSNLLSPHDVCPLPSLGCGDQGAASQLLGIGHKMSCSSNTSLLEYAEFLSEEFLSDGCSDKSPARNPAVQSFICNVCNHSLSLLPSSEHQTELARVWLTFLLQQLSSSGAAKRELKSEIRSVQKLFKNLLRVDQHRNNLELWNYYAQFEYLVGNFKESRGLYQSILTQCPQSSPVLCVSLCECFMGLQRCLREGEGEVDKNFCLHNLVCLAEGRTVSSTDDPISPARVLKARSHFSQHAASSTDYNTVLCCGYLEYLTRGVQEACCVFDDCAERLTRYLAGELGEGEKTATLQFLKQVYAKQLRLLEHHSSHHPTPPSLLRQVLERALKLFPNDRTFMAAFIRSERQTFISGRMRRYFDLVSPAAANPLPWLFSLAAELDRYWRVTGRRGGPGGVAGVEETSVGTLHRVRSLLVRAAASENARHCPLLWRIYMAVQVSRAFE